MITGGYLLVLIYSGLSIAIEPRDDLVSCIEDAGKRIGEKASVHFWDDMGGSNPIPKVVLAFCVQGASGVK